MLILFVLLGIAIAALAAPAIVDSVAYSRKFDGFAASVVGKRRDYGLIPPLGTVGHRHWITVQYGGDKTEEYLCKPSLYGSNDSNAMYNDIQIGDHITGMLRTDGYGPDGIGNTVLMNYEIQEPVALYGN